MSEQYEWDQTGEPSDELLHLESIMAELRYDAPLKASVADRPAKARWFAMAAAALLLVGVGATLWFRAGGDGSEVARQSCAPAGDDAWRVTILSGQPRCGEQGLVAPGSLPVGSAVETDLSSRAEIQVADIGHVVLEPSSRLALRTSSSHEHRMQLDYGTLHAVIDAPPRLFLVETPAALAVDLGCEYTLSVSVAGETHLRVTSGYVSLENGGEAMYVPAGFQSDSFLNVGTSVPYADDASEELVRATRALAHEAGSHAAFETLLRVSTRPADTLGLWHLLSRSGDECEAAIRRLHELSEVDPDPLGLGWGTCSDPDRQNAWQRVLQDFWKS